MATDCADLTIILYGLPRTPETDAALFADLRATIEHHAGPRLKAVCFKYDQRPDCVAHGGVLYADGGRKS